MSGKKKTTEQALPQFESIIKELDTLVQRMENSDISLEESLQAFEKGVKLTSEAQAVLAAAEQRVRVLTEKNGEPQSDTLDIDENDQ